MVGAGGGAVGVGGAVAVGVGGVPAGATWAAAGLAVCFGLVAVPEFEPQAASRATADTATRAIFRGFMVDCTFSNRGAGSSTIKTYRH